MRRLREPVSLAAGTVFLISLVIVAVYALTWVMGMMLDYLPLPFVIALLLLVASALVWDETR